MNFKKVKKGKKTLVYMQNGRKEQYVCEIVDDSTENAVAVNEHGLTLRARILRSKGQYAMSEGTIFNPRRLLDSACEITDHKTEEFKDADYKDGHTLLTITADGCINKYLIFSSVLLDELLKKIKSRKKA